MSAGVYLHIPFCKSRCSYCDFATDVLRENKVVDRYVDALCAEIRGGAYIDTIYFGGGTPSLLIPAQVERILAAVHREFEVALAAEVTMEMNPATVTPDSLAAYRLLGVNRASFGVQTFNDRDLRLLARGHDAADARSTFQMLRDAGYDNVSFDLIAGLPGQSLDDWERNLEEAVALSPEHISLYLLEIHEGTPLAEQLRTHRRPMPDADLAAEMYEVMLDRLAAAGYEQYEISNFCRPGFESRHNSKYWQLEPVYGFGVSAYSFDGSDRYSNERDTARYVGMIEKDGSAEVMRESVDLASEAAFLGLRMETGIAIDLDAVGQHAAEIQELSDAGLLEIRDNRMKLTRRGKLLSNEVFAVFV